MKIRYAESIYLKHTGTREVLLLFLSCVLQHIGDCHSSCMVVFHQNAVRQTPEHIAPLEPVFTYCDIRNPLRLY